MQPTQWRSFQRVMPWIPSWSDLYAFGRSKLLRTSYFWIFFVPIAAAFCSAVNKIGEQRVDFFAGLLKESGQVIEKIPAEILLKIGERYRQLSDDVKRELERRARKAVDLDKLAGEQEAANWLTSFFDFVRDKFHLPFQWKLFYLSTVAFGVAWAWYAIRCPPVVKNYLNYAKFRDAGNGEEALLWHLRSVIAMHEKELELENKVRFPLEEVLTTFAGRFCTEETQTLVADEFDRPGRGPLPPGEERDALVRSLVGSMRLVPDRMPDAFHFVWRLADRPRPVDRFACTVLFALGGVLFLFVLAEGFLEVLTTA